MSQRKKRASNAEHAYFIRVERRMVTGVARIPASDKQTVQWYRAQSDWKLVACDRYLSVRSQLCFC